MMATPHLVINAKLPISIIHFKPEENLFTPPYLQAVRQLYPHHMHPGIYYDLNAELLILRLQGNYLMLCYHEER
jgi:hypothetical protein